MIWLTHVKVYLKVCLLQMPAISFDPPFWEAITVFGAPHLTLALTSSIQKMYFFLEKMDLQSKQIFVIIFVYFLV